MAFALLLLALLASTAAPAAAQAPPASPFGITDNSFLIEEAFNQEPGIFQNIVVMARHVCRRRGRRMFNLMLEALAVWTRVDSVRESSVTVSPGFRLDWNLGEQQIVIGVGVPVTRGDRHDTAVLGYLSYELPFTHQ